MSKTALRAFIKSQTKRIYETHISGHSVIEAEEADSDESSGTDITALSTDDADEAGDDDGGGGSGGGGDKPAEDVADEKGDDDEKENLYTYKSMVTLFNAIRSGQSMKNKSVVSSLKELWDTLDEHHRKGLLSVLAKTAKIVSKKEDDSKEDSEQTSEEDFDETPSNSDSNEDKGL